MDSALVPILILLKITYRRSNIHYGMDGKGFYLVTWNKDGFPIKFIFG